MTRLAWAFALTSVFLCTRSTLGQQQPEVEVPNSQPGAFVDKVVEIDGEAHRYVVWLPPGYGDDDTRRWPLVVFLNGLGECGRDGKRQAAVGLGAALRKQPERWPFVVAFPQKPIGSTQWGDHEDLLLAVLKATEHDYRTEPKRTFLTGLSQGGSGAWQFGAQLADRWAAVAPVCGYRLGTWNVDGLRDKPVWAFHGTADSVVPMRASKMLCAELKKAGGHPVLTLYEGVGHNSWDRAYQQSALAEWFRVVVDQPLAARYLADHAAVTEVELRFAVDPAPGDDGPWGSQRFELTAKGQELSWSLRTEWRGAGPAPADAERSFHAAQLSEQEDWHGATADRLLWPTLQDLATSGIYTIEPQARTTSRVRVLLTVRGASGEWRHDVGLAATDRTTPLAVAAFERIRQRARDAAITSDRRR